jgi:hypothetical protein
MDIEVERSEQDRKQRYFVLLEEDKEAEFLRKVLKNLLDLVVSTLDGIFSKGLKEYDQYLSDAKKEKKKKKEVEEDESVISELISGRVRSGDLRRNYPLADFHHTMFSFQEYFHSSYRARKGSVLEGVLAEYCSQLGYTVYSSKSDAWSAIAKALNIKDGWKAITQKLQEKKKPAAPDVDLVTEYTKNGKNHLLVIQLRSRDDTGGTTAKASLTKALEPIATLAKENKPRQTIIYLIGIWEPRDEQQRTSLVNEVIRTLKQYIAKEEEDIHNKISQGQGTMICQDVFLRLAYGAEEIESFINQKVFGVQHQSFESRHRDAASLSEIVNKLRRWDDLWLTYAVVTIELSCFLMKGKSNIDYLIDKLKYTNHRVSKENVDTLASELLSSWEDTALPFEKPADNYLYIRDMLYLYIIYQQHRSQTGKQREQTNTGIQSQQQHRSRTGKRRKKPNTEIQSQQQFPTMEGL